MAQVHCCNIWLLCCPAQAKLLATTAKGGLGRGSSTVNNNDDDNNCEKFESDNDRNPTAAAMMLPNFWWRVLGISTEDIANALDTLLGVCAWKGLKNACRMRRF
jgi:hypothetical protein